jgi:SAM-dependent methyltransferase
MRLGRRSRVLLEQARRMDRIEQRLDDLVRAVEGINASRRAEADGFAEQLAWMHRRLRVELDMELDAVRAAFTARQDALERSAVAEARVLDIAEALRLHGQRHAEELNRASMTAVNEVLDALRLTLEQYGDVLRDDRRRLDGLNRAVRRLEQPHAPGAAASASAASTAAAAPAPAPADDISPDLYLALEDRFRGSVELIAERQRAYLPYLAELPFPERPVVDLGCGRGEFLSLLRDKGIAAFGVDSNPDAVTVASELGVEVRQDDLMAFLRSTENASLRAITMFQVVEHLPFAVLAQFFDEAVRVLVPGGLLLAETPNALNLRVAATTFWLDPTTPNCWRSSPRRPVSPGATACSSTRRGRWPTGPTRSSGCATTSSTARRTSRYWPGPLRADAGAAEPAARRDRASAATASKASSTTGQR